MKLVDTHAHLYWDSFKEDFDEIIKRCTDSGVTTIINVGVDVKLSTLAAELESDQIKLYSTIGIHPHNSVKYLSSQSIHKDIKQLEKLYYTYPNKIVAVGECGLDYFFDHAGLLPTNISEDQAIKLQKELFKAQIDLAKKLNLPLIVHCRDDRSKNPQNSEAWDEVLKMIDEHPTVLHCYSGLLKTTQQVLNMPNVLVSFAATLTYPKNDYLREAVKILPLERIVLETDCPFLPPQSKRGQRNEPANISETTQIVADIKGVSLEKVAHQTSTNAARIFAF